MLKYNLSRSAKNLLQLRGHQLIGISGLAIGFSFVLVISAWIVQELNYDRFHNDSERIYMVTTDIKDNQGGLIRFPETPPPLASSLKEGIPAIQYSTQFVYLYGGRNLKTNDTQLRETGVASGPHFFDVFSFELTIGNVQSLSDPGTIFLTESLAQKMFPRQDPMGRTLYYDKDKSLTVKGVIKNLPENSSLKFSYVVPYELESENPNEWRQLSDATFIKLGEDSNYEWIKSLSQEIFRQNITDDQYDLNLIPLSDLRYKADFDFFQAEHGDVKKMFTFISVAVLILVLSCLNYINLSTANAYRRKIEVMVRRVNGATRNQLISYFLTESIIASLLVWIIGILVSSFLIMGFESLTDSQIVPKHLFQAGAIGLPASIILIGILAGLFPAMVASSFGTLGSGSGNRVTSLTQGGLRNTFVLTQFVLSITLCISSIVIYQQVNFMKNYDVGYQKNNIIRMMLSSDMKAKAQAVKNDLLAEPEIIQVCFAGASPVNLTPIFTTENWQWSGLDDNSYTSIYRLYVDEDYLDVFELEMAKGKFFTSKQTNGSKLVVNEKLANLIGWADPVGRKIKHGKDEYEITGVVKDFNFQHLSNPIKPLVLMHSNTKNVMFIKTRNFPESQMAAVNQVIKRFAQNPLAYSFVTDKFEELYGEERGLSLALITLTLLTILLSCIGMMGMITYTVESRTKEIAIRKVNGAKTEEVVLLLNKGMLMWFSIGFILSCILTWFAMHKWLENFLYRINLEWWVYLTGALLVFAANSLTISWQTWKAANQNPVKSLRYE